MMKPAQLMKRFLYRALSRLLLLFIGGAALWFLVFNVFEYVDTKTPLFLALFLTYLVGAYIVFPFAIRLIRIFLKPNHIPEYASTPDGFLCDPINVGIVGTKESLTKAMQAAGWYVADRKTPHTALRQIYSFVFKKPYPNAPFSTLYLFGRRQDIGFEMAVNDSVTERHHVRFWACKTNGHAKFTEHVQFWSRHYFAAHTADRYLWVGAATKDVGIAIIRHNLQITHAIDEDTNKERDYLLKTLKSTGYVHSIRVVRAGPSHKQKNRGLGVTMIVDGNMHIAILK